MKENSVKLQITFRFIFSLFCSSVCLYQIIDICYIYFSYKTTTFVRYDNQSLISLPAITLCMDKKYFFKPLEDGKSHGADKIKRNDRIVDGVAQLKIIYQFNRMVNNFEDFFDKCSVVRPKGVPPEEDQGLYVQCDSVTPIRIFLDYHK